MKQDISINVAVIVAHPDDETLWAGGTMMSHPQWNIFIISLCRASDPDRSPKFMAVMKEFGARGTMADLDDSPLQEPLPEEEVQQTIVDLLPVRHYDLIITHHPRGEYTRHRRHEETSKAVIALWNNGAIQTKELWCFAYSDGGRKYYPKPDESATLVFPLNKEIWKKKYNLITEVYGFEKKSWEAQTTPDTESFWKFTHPGNAMSLISHQSA